MRELRFRFWNTVLKKFIRCDSSGRLGILINMNNDNDGDIIGMQYTGLKDKDGKEIYEGDILEEEKGYYFTVIYVADNYNCGFKLQWSSKAVQYPEWNRGVKMTVIGNIYENPDLL